MKTTHWPLTIFNIVVSLLQLFQPLVLVRLFPAEDIGFYKIFFLYLNLFQVLVWSSGLTHGLAFWNGRAKDGHALVAQAWSVLSCWSALLLIVGVLAPGFIMLLIGGSRIESILFVFSGCLFLICNFYEEVWIAQRRVWQAASFRGVSEIIRTAAILLVAWKTGDMYFVFLAHAAVMFIKLILSFVLGIFQDINLFIFRKDLLKEIFRYAVPVSTAGFLSAFANSADQLLLSQLLSKAQFAIFAMGCLTVPPVMAMEHSVNQLLAAKLSYFLGANDKDKAQRCYAEAIIELARIMIPCFVGMLIFAEPIVRILYSSAYLESVPILRFYALGYLLLIIPYDGGAKASGAGAWSFNVFLWKTLISVILVGAFTPFWGIYGAMSGVLISGVFLRVAGIAFNIKNLKWALLSFLPLMQIARIVVITLTLALAALAVRRLFPDDRLWFLVAGGAFSLIYGCLLLLPGQMKRALGYSPLA